MNRDWVLCRKYSCLHRFWRADDVTMRQRGDQAEGGYVNKKVLLAFAAAIAVPRIVQKKNRHSSGCDPMVVAEHSAEALSALNRVMGEGSDGHWLRYSVFQALMIALGMIVRHELPDRVLKRCRCEEDHPA